MVILLVAVIIAIAWMLCNRYGYYPVTGGGGHKLSKNRLAKLKDYLDSLNGAYSAIIIQDGKTIFDYGDTSGTSYIASMRKSILSILYGIYNINLDKTLDELGIDDNESLTEEEKSATVRDLISARSGIYHAASNGGDDPNKPERGTKKPGTHFVYNNWDFNVLGTIFKQETGIDIYDAVKKLGDELGFEDYDLEANKKNYDYRAKNRDKSIHPPYHMLISARDLSKIGLLMLNKGRWNGKQIVPKKWIEKSTSLITPQAQVAAGYGYLWWVYEREPKDPLYGAYRGQGAGGQRLIIIPKLKMVISTKRNDVSSDARINYKMVGEALGYNL